MKTLEKTAILATSMLTIIATAAIGPALSVIDAQFTSASPLLIKSVVTIPALICIPISLLSNKLSNYIRKKYLLIFGLILYLIASILSYFSNNIYSLLLTRGLFGLGLGIIAPLSLVVIGDFFEGKTRAKFMGYSTAVSDIGAVIAILIVGVLASLGWQNIFLIYLAGIVVLFLVIFFLPKIAPYDHSAPENKIESLNKDTSNIKLNKGVFKYSVIIILSFIVFYSVPTNMSLLIAYKHLGTPETSSYLIALITFSAFIGAMIFHRILKILKESLILFSFIFMAVGFILILLSNVVLIMAIGIIIAGIGFGIVVPYCLFYSAKCVHVKHTSLAITMVSTSIYVGESICPVVLNYIAKIFNLNNIIGLFYGAELLSIIAIIFSLYILLKSKKLNKVSI